MSTKVFEPQQSEFYHRYPENFILVENHEAGVTIRAAFNNFSERRRQLFIRELAAEGFIPDEYQFFVNTSASDALGVQWIVDKSWLRVHPAVEATAHRRLWMLYLGVLAMAFVMIVWLCLHSHR
jgi:hypothetical protein